MSGWKRQTPVSTAARRQGGTVEIRWRTQPLARPPSTRPTRRRSSKGSHGTEDRRGLTAALFIVAAIAGLVMVTYGRMWPGSIGI